ncbi:hypothetical protein ACWDV4_27115 [Micromonospora sp. NPDC003197]
MALLRSFEDHEYGPEYGTHAVCLEVHDSPPEPDPADWVEVLETPMATAEWSDWRW